MSETSDPKNLIKEARARQWKAMRKRVREALGIGVGASPMVETVTHLVMDILDERRDALEAAQKEIGLIEDEIPETFYAGLETRHRVAQLVRIWRNALEANVSLEETIDRADEHTKMLMGEVERLREPLEGAETAICNGLLGGEGVPLPPDENSCRLSVCYANAVLEDIRRALAGPSRDAEQVYDEGECPYGCKGAGRHWHPSEPAGDAEVKDA